MDAAGLYVRSLRRPRVDQLCVVLDNLTDQTWNTMTSLTFEHRAWHYIGQAYSTTLIFILILLQLCEQLQMVSRQFFLYP